MVSLVESGWAKLAYFHGSMNWPKVAWFHKESIMLNQYSILSNFKPLKPIDLSCISLITTESTLFYKHFPPKQSLPNQISNMILPLSIYHIIHRPNVLWQSLFYFHFGIYLIEEKIKGLTFWTTEHFQYPFIGICFEWLGDKTKEMHRRRTASTQNCINAELHPEYKTIKV